MLISHTWLREYVRAPRGAHPEEVGKRLSLATVEVEAVRREGAELAHIAVGLVKKVSAHPNADRLQVVEVDAGERAPVTVVCGGSNVRVGMRVALARIGARVRWHGAGDMVTLERTKIRGVESNGMICASTEMGLGEQFPLRSDKEILDLSHLDAPPGVSLAHALGLDDAVYEIDNKSLSNRPDLWGHIGIAREIGAIYRAPFGAPAPRRALAGSGIALKVTVKDAEACTRYMAVALRGVKSAPSPAWMQKRLRACGIRPINAIVDVTNYVMLESGQPLHAFDYDRVKDARGTVEMVVRRARREEEFTTLDGHKHTLNDGMLVISNREKGLALAGIMGGDASAVSDRTDTIILESATFNAQSIRRTSNTLGLRTESSARFEKGLDRASAEWGLNRAVELYKTICPGAETASAVADVCAQKTKQVALMLEDSFLKNKTGAPVSLSEARKILERLGFGVRAQGKKLRVAVPSFRSRDVRVQEDLVEEVLRMYGYDRIRAQLPQVYMRMPPSSHLRALTRAVKQHMALACGFHETRTYAFVRPRSIAALGLAPEEHVTLLHPLSEERPYVARTLAANLLEAVEKNQHEHNRIALFEIASVAAPDSALKGPDDGKGGHLPHQPLHFACVYHDKDESRPFAYVQEALNRTFGACGQKIEFKKSEAPMSWWHPRRSVEIWHADTRIGYLATVHSRTQETFGIDGETVCAEIDISALSQFAPRGASYRAPSPFPAVTRDAAFVLDESAAYADIVATLQGAHPLVRRVDLFDRYQGGAIGEGKKSMAFRITYQSSERTLTAEEADVAHRDVLERMRRAHHASVR